MAALPMPLATRRLALASRGITTRDNAAMMIPGKLRSGASCRINVAADQPGQDGYKTFKTVPADSEVFEPFATADKLVTVQRGRDRHLSILQLNEGLDLPSVQCFDNPTVRTKPLLSIGGEIFTYTD